MKILVTGGTGYIGTHTIVELVNAGHDVVAVDNLSNSSSDILDRIKLITGQDIKFYKADIRDRESLEYIFANHSFDCCMHFAGLKAVGESVLCPWEYYDNNVGGTLVLLDVMRKHNCKNIIFSSSATVYGNPLFLPITEDSPKVKCTNPYGSTKSMIEDMMSDLYFADKTKNNTDHWNVVLLRYFNPIGAHKSGLIGEAPKGTPNNLMPYITKVAAGELPELKIYGDDYETVDGTGVRDYIHIVDLAKGHVKALKAIENKCGVAIYNLGTGKGYSVLEIVHAFEDVTGIKIPYSIVSRRAGDVPACYADPTKAYKELGWRAQLDINDMCRDSWNWQKNKSNI